MKKLALVLVMTAAVAMVAQQPAGAAPQIAASNLVQRVAAPTMSDVYCAGFITNQSVPAYGELDVRLAWQPTSRWEFSVVGQNLLHERHPEFNLPAVRQEIEQIGRASCRERVYVLV